jgi:hypothetical protein
MTLIPGGMAILRVVASPSEDASAVTMQISRIPRIENLRLSRTVANGWRLCGRPTRWRKIDGRMSYFGKITDIAMSAVNRHRAL